ncbi:transposase [Clostridium perfringens]|uniref:helix-turn-helix domain-containing protein n=1 Tax=Clostridium perfringens TaxID=1502 RepID=UPI0013E3AFFF|nr:helix-turn-helix domain-containing protein [Clostridium perfringens]NGT78376.1 helix-turn-helix domain-containing protein [Clostridium perfringens]UBK73925.1 transposase [Clostridium perfringens]UBL09212.1 transposase [Clostridium perfringens]HAT4142023.1 helix-turn-helix domain-containing protein [Clostridium perfringens]HAT4146404.1 helix-turn-helix domain-containing protein [Clostridium perfringens]
MGRKAKISYEIKIKFVEEYLNGNISQNGIAKELGLHISSIQEWIRKYKIFGPDGLRVLKNSTYYNSDLKLSAVKDYINGIGSLADICLKYSISSTGILKQWISKYNKCHKTCKSHNKKEDHIMTNGRKTTYEERIEIVSFCIANAHDYNLTANKFNVSYQQVYTWVKKYNKNGYNALVDRRGKNKSFGELTESERFSAQLKLLEAENRRLKIENDFFKKLEEI